MLSMLFFLLWVIVVSLVVGVYLFGIFLVVYDFGSLVLVLVVIFLLLGLLLYWL